MQDLRIPSVDRRVLSSTIACALLAACASTSEPTTPAVVRTRAPEAYEKTIQNYFAFKLRGPQKNTRISVAPPEPGDCPIDGTPSSIRGWVVPVTHETFSGELTGKDTIRITAKPYWFWFSGETIAGITPRGDVCPGVVSAFDDVRLRTPGTTTQAPLQPVAARAATAEPARAPAPAKPASANTAKKKTTSPPAGGKQAAPKAKEPQGPAKPPE